MAEGRDGTVTGVPPQRSPADPAERELAVELSAAGLSPDRLTPVEAEHVIDELTADFAGDEPLVEEVEALHQSWLHWVVLWTLPLVLLAALGVVVVRADGAQSPTRLQMLTELVPGNYWRYDEQFNGKPAGHSWSEVVGKVLLGVTPAVAVRSHFDDLAGSPADWTSYFGDVAGKPVVLGSRYASGYEPVTPAEPYLTSAAVGYHHTWRGTDGSTPKTQVSTNVGYGSVQAAGRTLHDCLHQRLVTTVAGPTGYLETDDSWFCPGVGAAYTRADARNADGTSFTLEQRLSAFVSADRVLRGPDAPSATPPPGEETGFETGRAGAVPGRLALDAPLWTDSYAGETTFPPAVADGVSVVVRLDGSVVATDVATGHRLWQTMVVDPAVTAPVIAGSVVLVGDAAKSLRAFDLRDGTVVWSAHFPDVLSASPTVAGGVAVVTGEDAVTRGVDLRTGRVVWSERAESRTTDVLATAGSDVVGVSDEGEVTAREAATGEERWAFTMDGAARGGVTVLGADVLVSDDTGTLYDVRTGSGRVRWEASIDPTVAAHPAAADGRFFVVDGNGRLYAWSAETGRREWRVTVPGGVSAPPVVVGDEVVVLAGDGRLHTYATGDGTARQTHALPLNGDELEHAPELSVGESEAGSFLVVTGEASAPLRTTMAAYAVQSVGGAVPDRRGIAFDVTRRRLGGTAESPVHLLDGTFDGRILYNERNRVVIAGPRGLDVLLTDRDNVQPFAVPGPGLVYVQRGHLLEALRPDGTTAWTFPMADPLPGTVPVLDGDVLVVPIRGVALVGLDPSTGALRWRTPEVTSGGITTGGSPLVLPGGDIFYSGVRLQRIDPRTGKVRWSGPPAPVFGPLATTGGLGFAADLAASQLLAVDLGTGQVRWTLPVDGEVLSGVTAVDGTVAVVDRASVLHVVDATTGDERWQVPLDSQVVGSPVIEGGRVFVDEEGPEEVTLESGHRLMAFDVADAAWLGGWDSASSGLTTSGFAAGPDGSLLMADTFTYPSLDLVKVGSG